LGVGRQGLSGTAPKGWPGRASRKNSNWGHHVKAPAELILITPPLFGNRSERRPTPTRDDPPDKNGDILFCA
jgi:hypothetical protein